MISACGGLNRPQTFCTCHNCSLIFHDHIVPQSVLSGGSTLLEWKLVGKCVNAVTQCLSTVNGVQEEQLTVICDNLLSIFILCGFITDQHEVPLMAASTAQVVHQVGAILQTGVPLSKQNNRNTCQYHTMQLNNTKSSLQNVFSWVCYTNKSNKILSSLLTKCTHFETL